MGGNALKNCVTKRLPAEEYTHLKNEVIGILTRFFPRSNISPIAHYKNKKDFGDLDVLFELVPDSRHPDTDFIKHAFGSKEVIKNGNVISFEYQEFQVDLIMVSSLEYVSSWIYLAYNDLGNLMGRIACKMGFTYGHRGLIYKFRTNDDHVVSEIIVSTSGRDTFSFLGYDIEVFEKGFDDIEDIFKFVVSSQYFNKDIYLLDNRNYISRTRDKKRKTYNEFLKWVSDKHGFPEYPWATVDERGVTRNTKHLDRAFSLFPQFEDEYKKVQAQVARYEKFKALFNGDIVRDLTGLKDQELGNLMKTMRNWGDQCLEGSLQEHILKLETPEKIEYFIKDFASAKKGFTICNT